MIYSSHDETIIAQCTPRGTGAIALIRLSGINVFDVAEKLIKLPKNKILKDLVTHTIHFGWIKNYSLENLNLNILETKNNVDQVMIIIMRAPNSFTGQDTIEITCHNNPLIVEEIINLAIKAGARYAQEGEFAQRAFLNKKIDLIQAESINDLINAQTQIALKKSLAQLEGSFSNWIEHIEQELLKIFSWCETSFEFVEEVPEFGEKIKINLKDLIKKINKIKSTFDINKQIRQGIKIALIGAVNAGKSSLLNLILGQKRAIVSPVPGTTRDTIEALISQNGNNITLIDTAGIRQTENLIEKEGVIRSLEEAKKADIILLIFDGSRALTEQEIELYNEILEKYKNKIILIQNKSDLKENLENLKFFNKISPEIKLLKISSKQDPEKLSSEQTSETINNFVEIIFNEVNQKISSLFSNLDAPFLLNERQYKILVKIEQDLEKILNMISRNPQYEIISVHIQDCLEQVSQLTGKTIKDEMLNKIFKEFCIGK